MSRLSYQKKAERWDVWEVSCHGPEEGNPFADHWMKGSFSCDKETVDADGFYDGDGIYKVRFMPSYEGEYTFKGFYGDYELEATVNGKVLPLKFTLSPNDEAEKTFVV